MCNPKRARRGAFEGLKCVVIKAYACLGVAAPAFALVRVSPRRPPDPRSGELDGVKVGSGCRGLFDRAMRGAHQRLIKLLLLLLLLHGAHLRNPRVRPVGAVGVPI
jgi:hypothetical protein